MLGDTLTFSIFYFLFPACRLLVVGLLLSIWFCEFVAVLAKSLPAGLRRQESLGGGKPERALWLGIFSLAWAWSPASEALAPFFLGLLTLLVVLSGLRRIACALVALFLIALTTHPAATALFLGIFSLLALYEYLSFAPERFSLPILGFALLQVPLNLTLHYVGQSALSPVYFFLLAALAVPSLLVLENRPESSLMRYGYLVSGLGFFVFSFGYAAALAQKAIMVLMVCFFLTEIRDLSSYWLLPRKLAATSAPNGTLRTLRHRADHSLPGRAQRGGSGQPPARRPERGANLGRAPAAEAPLAGAPGTRPGTEGLPPPGGLLIGRKGTSKTDPPAPSSKTTA